MKKMMFESDLMVMNRAGYFGLILLIFGLISNSCDARAVNISNTWTLPHDGFTVFYRFFRDQISWFEADAVCQFHHANLVTVTNSVEFDASREFLRILDVTEPVWIGLMRSQNSDRFYWSNSKPLVSTAEYWAESLPVIDAPLCAVIDPVRDYRWHALRCGGPETASFLCEMNVPSWAEECVIRDIPSLTIQYMADSGTVEITKDCGDDEGVIIQVCRGKQDLDKIINSLICKNEKIQQEIQQIFSHERQNLIINSDLLDSHKKSIDIIKNAQTDNNEDNNINIQNNNGLRPVEKISEQETENPVQKLIEQFDVEELMQADQPQEQIKQDQQQSSVASDEMTTTTSTTGTQKPFKRQNKKVKSGDKKSNKKSTDEQQKKQRGKNIAIEDMMMGDQPILGFGDDDLNEIQEPLPHTKKMLPQDLKHEDDNLARDKELNKNMRDKIPDKIMSTTTTTTQSAIATGTVHLIAEKETGPVTIDNVDDETSTATTPLPVITADELNDDINRSSGVISTMIPLISEENLNIASLASSDSTISSLSSEASISITTGELESLPSSSFPTHINSHESTSTSSPSHESVITTLSPGELKPTPAVTIGHPMHPQQPRSNVISEETAHQHIKETNDNHFIPPMLMVKSHYQSPKSTLGHNTEHQLDLQIVRKKTTPTDLNSTTLITSNDDISHHFVAESNSISTTTLKTVTPDSSNVNHHTTTVNIGNMMETEYDKHPKSDTAADIILEHSPTAVLTEEKLTLTTVPEIEATEENLNTVSTSTTLVLKGETESKSDTNKDIFVSQQITPTATVTPNQLVEIKLSTDAGSTEKSITFSITTRPESLSSDEISKLPTTINTEPVRSSLPLTSNDNFKNIETAIKTEYDETHLIKSEPDNLSAAESLKLTSTTFNAAVLKPDLPTILTTIVGDTNILTSTQENFKNLDELSTADTTVTSSDRKTFTSDNINNFTISESNEQHNNKDQYNNKEEHSVTPTRATSTTIKTLVPTKKITSTSKKHNLKRTSSSSSLLSAGAVATPKTLSSSSLTSLEEESVGHHDVYSSDEENFEPHKPNRKRILTKPETTSYLKKILG